MAELPNFQLLPADARPSPEEDLSAAVAGALALPSSMRPTPPDLQAPLGRSWQFDWEQGRFVRAGGSPADTRGFGAVIEWCQMTIHSARYAHAVFSDEFGMEDPDEPVGEFAVGEVLADWQRHLIDALLVHDRVTSIENLNLSWDPSVGELTINSFDVVTDEDERLTVNAAAVITP